MLLLQTQTPTQPPPISSPRSVYLAFRGAWDFRVFGVFTSECFFKFIRRFRLFPFCSSFLHISFRIVFKSFLKCRAET